MSHTFLSMTEVIRAFAFVESVTGKHPDQSEEFIDISAN